MLRLNHALSKTAIATVKPSVTASTVTPSQIKATSFLKYFSVSLIDKIQILNLYQNLATQATSYNVFIRPRFEITVQKWVIPNGMLPES